MENTKWVAGWSAATSVTSQTCADYFEDQTFRYVIFPTVSASAVRLHFSSKFNKEDTELTKVVVAKCAGDFRTDASTNASVTFGGYDSVILKAGESLVSDPIDFNVTAGENISISIYFAKRTHMYTGHTNSGAYIKNYYGKGDFAEADEIPWSVRGGDAPYLFLHTVDFLTTEDVEAIVAFGDSITARPWPDCLARRIFNSGIRNRTVLRKGISGSRILKEYSHREKAHFGPAGIKRFEEDILQAGVERIIVLHGINDLIHPAPDRVWCPMDQLPTTAEMIDGLRQYVNIAHKHSKKIYLSTILPCRQCMIEDGTRNNIRLEVNEWIRTNKEADGFVDLDLALRDPEDNMRLKEEYNCGDHLHPSFAGSSKIANSVPEDIILG